MPPTTYAERARALVHRWLDSPEADIEITDEGATLRDVLDVSDGARAALERRIADALRRAVSQ